MIYQYNNTGSLFPKSDLDQKLKNYVDHPTNNNCIQIKLMK